MDNLNTHQSREQKEKKIQEIEDEKWSWKKTNELSKRQTNYEKNISNTININIIFLLLSSIHFRCTYGIY